MRLLRGEETAETVYSDEPLAVATGFERSGAPWLHVVDLDGALRGKAKNRPVIREIVTEVEIPVQVGGGIRNDADVEELLAAGVSRVVIGTRAAEDPDFVRRCVTKFGAEAVAVGIDVRRGRVMTRGWRHGSDVDALEVARTMAQVGVRWAVFTEISRDGTLAGPDLEAIRAVAAGSDLQIIASGGIGRLEDLVALSKLKSEGVAGAIVGKALYEGRFTLREALQTVGSRERAPC